MLSVDGCIKTVKINKNLEKLYNKKSWLFMTKKKLAVYQWISVRFFKIRHLILETLCRIHVPLVHHEISNHYSFSTSLIKTPHNPDDGSVEPKRYSFDWQIVGLLSIIFFHSVPLTNKIHTHSPTPVSHINNIKMFRRCRDLLKNKKTPITNFTQEK